MNLYATFFTYLKSNKTLKRINFIAQSNGKMTLISPRSTV